MNIVEPKVEYWELKDPIDHVARVAHTCYCSEDKGHKANEKFYNNLIKSGHYSPLRHESCYYIIPEEAFEDHQALLTYIVGSPYVEMSKSLETSGLGEHKTMHYGIATNGQFMLEHVEFKTFISPYKVTPEEFQKKYPRLMRFTFCLTTQISTSRELNRQKISIMEMSTRYIKFGGKVEPSIVRPWWMSGEEANHWEDDIYKGNSIKTNLYLNYCCDAFNGYNALLEYGMKPEDARGVLSLDTLTKVIYTGSISEWEHILQMRLLDSTGKAHGNCHIICQLVYDEFQKLGYKFNKNNELVYETKSK